EPGSGPSLSRRIRRAYARQVRLAWGSLPLGDRISGRARLKTARRPDNDARSFARSIIRSGLFRPKAAPTTRASRTTVREGLFARSDPEHVNTTVDRATALDV